MAAKKTKRPSAQERESLIKRASLREHKRRIAIGVKQIKRYVAASKGELPTEESHKAWREFGELAARCFRRGRLWNPDTLMYLALALVTIDTETEAIDAAFAAVEACADDPKLLRRIKSHFKHIPTIECMDALIKALGTNGLDAETGRRLAGYLPQEMQKAGAAREWSAAHFKAGEGGAR